MKVKRLAVIAIVSDDQLMETLVLKGGNALDIAYNASGRASIDLDFSMGDAFSRDEIEKVAQRIEKRLVETFAEKNLVAFDIRMIERPSNISSDLVDFWGGYKVEFKIALKEKFEAAKGDLTTARRAAEVVGPAQKRIFIIDISKYELCSNKCAKEIDGFTVYVYTPEMIVCEKLRAICQQMPEYRNVVSTQTASARARDFFDIWFVLEHIGADIASPEFACLLSQVFDQKKVPLSFLGELAIHKEFHRPDWPSVTATVKPGVKLDNFDFYFTYVCSRFTSFAR